MLPDWHAEALVVRGFVSRVGGRSGHRWIGRRRISAAYLLCEVEQRLRGRRLGRRRRRRVASQTASSGGAGHCLPAALRAEATGGGFPEHLQILSRKLRILSGRGRLSGRRLALRQRQQREVADVAERDGHATWRRQTARRGGHGRLGRIGARRSSGEGELAHSLQFRCGAGHRVGRAAVRWRVGAVEGLYAVLALGG